MQLLQFNEFQLKTLLQLHQERTKQITTQNESLAKQSESLTRQSEELTKQKLAEEATKQMIEQTKQVLAQEEAKQRVSEEVTKQQQEKTKQISKQIRQKEQSEQQAQLDFKRSSGGLSGTSRTPKRKFCRNNSNQRPDEHRPLRRSLRIKLMSARRKKTRDIWLLSIRCKLA